MNSKDKMMKYTGKLNSRETEIMSLASYMCVRSRLVQSSKFSTPPPVNQ